MVLRIYRCLFSIYKHKLDKKSNNNNNDNDNQTKPNNDLSQVTPKRSTRPKNKSNKNNNNNNNNNRKTHVPGYCIVGSYVSGKLSGISSCDSIYPEPGGALMNNRVVDGDFWKDGIVDDNVDDVEDDFDVDNVVDDDDDDDDDNDNDVVEEDDF